MAHALNFSGSGESKDAIGRTHVKALNLRDDNSDGKEATIRTREMMTRIGGGTPIRRKSTSFGRCARKFK